MSGEKAAGGPSRPNVHVAKDRIFLSALPPPSEGDRTESDSIGMPALLAECCREMKRGGEGPGRTGHPCAVHTWDHRPGVNI